VHLECVIVLTGLSHTIMFSYLRGLQRLRGSTVPDARKERYPLTDPSTRHFVHCRLCSVEEGASSPSVRAYR